MSIFIKTGFWKKFLDTKAPEGWFNLGKYIQDLINSTPSNGVESVTGSLVDNTDPKNPVIDLGYKVYTALLSQTGTNDPVAYELKNTLDVTITWSRDDTGRYYGTASSDIFANNNANHKQFALVGADRAVTQTKTFSIDFSDTTINLDSLDETGSFADGLMNLLPIEIRVYP